MTMHVVLGDGLLPAKELDALLRDLSERATDADDPFWFLIHGKPEPTATDTALVKWLIDEGVYYEMISDGSESDLYEGYQEKYTVKRLAPKVVSLMQERPEEGEEAHLLALFASDDPDAEEDRWLNDVIQAVTDAEFMVLAMNDGMQEIRIVSTDEGDGDEAVEDEVAEAVEDDYTREALEEMDLDGLKEVAAKLGISLPPRTRMATYVEAILGNTKDEEVEVTDLDEGAVVAAAINGEAITFSASNPVLVGAAMMIVVYNGTVVSRAISDEEARTLMNV